MNCYRSVGLVAFILLLQGCVATPPNRITKPADPEQSLTESQSQQLNRSNPELHSHYIKTWQQGEQNAVLNWMELGTRAIYMEEHEDAENAFDSALFGIEQLFTESDLAEQARSLWYNEGRKIFKGEPYERVMAYFYRGILYMAAGDYGNARASFESGILQDAFAEEMQYRADFGLMYLMSAWASEKDGTQNLADQAYTELASLRPEFVRPPIEHNVLIVLETGSAPRKLSDGLGHTKLVYRRGKRFTEYAAQVQFVPDSQNQPAYPIEDIFFQASTRGGRHVDAIIEGKLEFQKSAESIGSNLSDSANVVLESTRYSTIGQSSVGKYVGATKALAALALGIGAEVKPQADTRYWTSLPDTVHIITAKLPIGHDYVIGNFFDDAGDELYELQSRAKVHFDRNGNGVAMIRPTK